jgi:hypothetical protein
MFFAEKRTYETFFVLPQAIRMVLLMLSPACGDAVAR